MSAHRLRPLHDRELTSITIEAEKYLPESLSVYGYLAFGFKHGALDKEKTIIYIPEEEDSAFFSVITGVTGIKDCSSMAIYWKIGTVPRSVVADYLASLPDVNWYKRSVHFMACPENNLDELEIIITDERLGGTHHKRKKSITGYSYWLERDLLISANELPANFVLGELKENDAYQIYDSWGYKWSDTIESVKKMVKYLPSSAVFYQPNNSNNRELVAWALTKLGGEIGLTHTIDKYRGKGLATIVTRNVARKHQMLGFNPFISVEVYNDISINLHQKIGFQPCTTIGWDFYHRVDDAIMHNS